MLPAKTDLIRGIIASLMCLSIGSLVPVSAQSVPPTVRREIISLLRNYDDLCRNSSATLTVDAVKIAPKKTGYFGECKYGGGPSVLFEKTPTGYKKLIAVDTGMNGYISRTNRLTKGYYDFAHSERGGNEMEITTYKWNGTRYVPGRPKITKVPFGG